jgi:hypothetical protein
VSLSGVTESVITVALEAVHGADTCAVIWIALAEEESGHTTGLL